jgi:hypothetical protein
MGHRPKEDRMRILTVDSISTSCTLLLTVRCPATKPKRQRNSSYAAVQAAAVKSHCSAQILSVGVYLLKSVPGCKEECQPSRSPHLFVYDVN